MSVSSASGSIPLRPRSLSASSGSNSVQLAQAARRVNSVAGSVPLTSTTQQPVQGISGSVSVLPQATQPSPSTVSPVGSNIAVQATRAPNIAIVANRVQRAVAPVFVSTHAFGTKLDRSSTSEQQAELQACFDKIHDKLIQESLLNGRETGVRVHFERCVVSYIDEHGVPQEKSILPKMESDHEFNDLVEDLARCAREILGKPGYTIHSLKDMAKRPASNGPTSTFRRSGSYGQYKLSKES